LNPAASPSPSASPSLGAALRSAPLELAAVALGMFLAVRHQWLTDDGYIYLTYVDNLVVHGVGAVFNAGEYVEGYTSVLWFALLALSRWLAVLVDPGLLTARQTALLVSHAATLLCFLALVLGNRRAHAAAARRLQAAARQRVHGGRPADRAGGRLNLALLLFVGLDPFRQFTTSGLETPLVMLFAILSGFQLLAPTLTLVPAALLVAAGPLIRPDLALVSTVLVLRFAQSRGWRHLPALVALAALPNLLVVALRVAYYAALLPNTYYAKTGLAQLPAQGVQYLRDLSLAYGVQWLVPLALLGGWLRRLRTGDRAEWTGRLWIFGALVSHGVFVVRVGGDYMHGRFWLPDMTLLAVSFTGVGSELLRVVAPHATGLRQAGLRVALSAGVLALCFWQRPLQVEVDGEESTFLFHGISSAREFARAITPAVHAWSIESDPKFARAERTISELAARLGDELGIPSSAIGVTSYYTKAGPGDVYVYDYIGLTQPAVARLDMRNWVRQVGHGRWAPQVLITTNERVDFSLAYFDGYQERFAVDTEQPLGALVDLDLLDRLADFWPAAPAPDELRGWLASELERGIVDANFVFFLGRRYRARDELHARIEEVGAAIGRPSSWERWFTANAATLAALDEQVHNDHAFLRNLRIAVRNHRLDPLPFLRQAPDYAVADRARLATWNLAPELLRAAGDLDEERGVVRGRGARTLRLGRFGDGEATRFFVDYTGRCDRGVRLALVAGGERVELRRDEVLRVPGTGEVELALRIEGEGEFRIGRLLVYAE